jgi:hypothetical protein
MAVGHAHPTDALVDDLVRLYGTNATRLEGIVRAGLSRGLDASRLGTAGQQRGDATHAYRLRQLDQARTILDELDRTARTAAPLMIGKAYGSGVVSVDRNLTSNSIARAGIAGSFGRVHVGAVEALAANLTGGLELATQRVRANVAGVFAAADALEGPIPGTGKIAGVGFLGRRFDDAYRRLALEEVAGGIISLDTRRQTSARLAERLVREGVTSATAGFRDRAGRRWPLDVYVRMVARTTTREAMTLGTTNRLEEHGVDLVTVSRHVHPADECSQYEGKTYSLTGATPGFERLPARPPFHPNCAHVLGPATADLDAFEEELARTASSRSRPAPATPPATTPAAPAPSAPLPPAPAAPATPPAAAHAAGASLDAYGAARAPIERLAERREPPAPPFTDEVRPIYNHHTQERYDDGRIAELIAGDPGPDADAFDALFEEAKRDERRQVKALKTAMGPDLASFVLGGHGRRPRAYAVEEDYRGRLLRGEVTIADVEREVREYEEDRYHEEQQRQLRRRVKLRPIPCFSCGKFKPRASSICQVCGDDPVANVDASDATSGGYTENARGESVYTESAGLTEARRRLDIDVYGLDPDDPTLDPDGPAIGASASTVAGYSAGARRRRALRAAQEGKRRR